MKIEIWRFKLIMGEILIKLEQYPKALTILQDVKHELENMTDYQKVNIEKFQFHYVNVLQQIGNIYRIIKRFDESEKNLLAAVDQIKNTNSATSFYYLYADLGELYYHTKEYEKANNFYAKAEIEATKINNINQKRYVWAWMANIYHLLKHHDLAQEYAQKSIASGGLLVTQRLGYKALYGIFESKNEWEKALMNYKEFHRITDSLLTRRKLTEAISLQNQFELDQLALRSRQAQEIEAQKLVALQKQAELDRVRAQATQDALTAQTIEMELKNRLETQSLKTQAQRIQNNQVRKIKELEISELSHRLALQQRTQNFLWIGTGLLVLLLGGIFWYNRLLSFKNVQLATKNQEITEALLRGQTTERKRVAAELHDNLGGLLGALKMTTNALNANSLRPQEKAIYGEIVSMIDDANAQVRSLSHNLLPQELEKHGLIPSLERLVSKLNLGSKTHFKLEISGFSQRLNPQTEVHLYAIILELCNNILKHAQATQAFIELHQQAHHSLLLVSDNGKGFDFGSNAEKGVGFQNLQERARILGNQLMIRSQQGEGTVISLKFNQLNHA
ncbi:histidine kinase [Runella sp. SP2]|uniref:tetratricopeptide repeat-containing sensor histidine kinase n=1 Tax=Runella sp. SP2 TaxID=2268026 RepID=UPI0013DDF97B|nr:histidine kinase [Runella sp. SP2]